MITIENEQFTVKVAPLGAELRSFVEKSTGRELMWSGDPSVWGGTAPILFPVVGKSRDGQTTIRGKIYNMPKHGVVRTREAEMVEHNADRAVLAFSANAKTLEHYPFNFRLEVEFKLAANQLNVSYRVKNKGADEMLFTIGSHPAFALDLKNAALEDYYIEFDQPETLNLYGLAGGLFAAKQPDYLANESRIPLSATLFDDDALIFKNVRSRRVRLKSDKTPGCLEFDMGNHPHLGLWAKPGAAYVCIEPWYSHDDAPDCDGLFEHKAGMMRLGAGENFKTGYAVRLHD